MAPQEAPLDRSQSEGTLETRTYLEGCLSGSPGELLRAVPGRETYGVQGPRGREWVLKRFSSRGIFSSPAEREFNALQALSELGLPVPSPIAFIERGRSSLLAMERVPSSRNLREELAVISRADSEPLIERLLELLISLHSAGWHHRDLYLHHILIDDEGELALIDLGRARRPLWIRRRWFAKDLAALLLWTPLEVSDQERLRFLARYMNRMEMLGRGERRRFLLDVLLRRERMARHRPRHGESGEWEPLK
jgi:tRNA A-37 threonylcarbamoyl transferase component Bud32